MRDWLFSYEAKVPRINETVNGKIWAKGLKQHTAVKRATRYVRNSLPKYSRIKSLELLKCVELN